MMWTATALVALLFGASGPRTGMYLDVPFVRQSPRLCATASLAMTVRYWNDDVDHHALAAAAGKDGALSGADLERLAQSRGFAARAFIGSDDVLATLLRSGRPVIVGLAPASPGSPNHFVVIVGMSPDGWIVHDPAAGPFRRIERTAFASRWTRLRNWSLVVERTAAAEIYERTTAEAPERPSPATAYWQRASAHFRAQRYGAAREAVREGLAVAPSDPYGHDFLATLLHLEGRTAEALHHWEAAGASPRVRTIEYRVDDEELADTLARVHRINEGERLTRAQWIDASWLQRQLLPRQTVSSRLAAVDDDDWELQIAAHSHAGGSWKTQAARNMTAALFDRQISVDVPRTGLSPLALGMRWQAADRRVHAEWQRLFITPHTDRLRVSVDLRDERWVATDAGDRERVQSAEVSASYDYFMMNRRALSTRLGVLRHSGRSYAISGAEWQQTVALNLADSIRAHWKLQGDVFLPTGSSERPARRLLASAAVRWQHPDETTTLAVRVSGGAIGGDLPRDRQFVLGIGPEATLLLRAHPVLRDGAKGASPVGRRFGLLNFGGERHLLRVGLVEARALLFADHALVGGDSYLDAGGGVRLRVWTQSIDVLAARDMRSGGVRYWAGVSRTF